MMKQKFQRGFSLVELMIAVAIIGVLATIGIPAYTGYVETARKGALLESMQSIRLFEEEARLSTGSYQAGTYSPADPNNVAGLKAVLGWSPNTTSDDVTYVVDEITATGYRVTATHTDGTVMQKSYSR